MKILSELGGVTTLQKQSMACTALGLEQTESVSTEPKVLVETKL